MIKDGFNMWLLNNNITRPVLVFTDWHDTRANYFLAEKLTSLGIVLIGLLPNTTHLLQPLDVAVFGPMQNGWRKASTEWRQNNPDDEITIINFASIFIPYYYQRANKPETVIGGFKRCRLYPFDPDQPDYRTLEAAAHQKAHPTPFCGDRSK